MGKLSNLINQMFHRSLESAEFTSANPTHINELIQINEVDEPDLEKVIIELIKNEPSLKTDDKKSDEQIETEKKLKSATDKLKEFDTGHIGEVQRFTQEQFGNLKSVVTDPATFFFQAFMRKFAKGAGVIALALFIFEAVQWIIGELLKPGRWLDRRFRRDIEHEILAFRSREDKQKLNQGRTQIIVSSIHSIRGGEGQVFNSYRTVASGQSLFNKNFTQPQTESIAAGLDMSKYKRKRFGQ